MFESGIETVEITTEDASSEYRLVTEVVLNESTNVEVNRVSRYIAASDNPQPIVRRENAGGLVNDVTPEILKTTITVDELAPNTITRTTKNRLIDGVIVSSTSKLG